MVDKLTFPKRERYWQYKGYQYKVIPSRYVLEGSWDFESENCIYRYEFLTLSKKVAPPSSRVAVI